MLNVPFFPDQASTMAPRVDAIFGFLLLVTAFFSLLIASLIIYFTVKYHHRTAADRSGARDSHLLLELTWTAIPTIIVLGVFFWGAKLFYDAKTIPPNAMEIFVVGKRWMWKIQHPEGQREINTLHIPIGRPVQLTMISEDVIHNFSVPAFRVKQDVLPGRYTKQWFQATTPGVYHLFCDQYCGTLHAQMVGKVIAMTPKDYEHWLNGAGSEPAPSGVAPSSAAPPGEASEAAMVVSGEKLYQEFRCNICHPSDGTGLGPALEGLYGRTVLLTNGRSVVADAGYIRESILKPGAAIVKGYRPVMPTFQGQLEESEILQLVAYIESLRKTK
jgi:cytochrome c oxidase subunit II